METVIIDRAAIDSLTFSIGMLAEQVERLRNEVDELRGYARTSDQRWQTWSDLAESAQPMIKDGYALAVEELQALEDDLTPDDLVRLGRRLLRNVRTFDSLLSELEGVQDLVHGAAPLTGDMVASATELMAEIERKGYPGFVREAAGIFDRIVTSFSEEDVRQLGDNVVLILNTVKSLTQPEIMTMMANLTGTLRDIERQPASAPPSVFALMRQLNEPEVRRGLSLALSMVKAVAPSNGENEPSPN